MNWDFVSAATHFFNHQFLSNNPPPPTPAAIALSPSSLARHLQRVTLYFRQILLSLRLCPVLSKAAFKLNQLTRTCVPVCVCTWVCARGCVRACPSVSICMCLFACVSRRLFQMMCCISAPPLPSPVMSQPYRARACAVVCVMWTCQ